MALGVFFILFISARNSSLTLFFLFALYLLFYFKKSLTSKLIFITVLMAVIAMTIGLNKNLSQRLHVNDSFEKTWANLSANEPRAAIWPCAFALTRQPDFNFFFGFSSEDEIREKLSDCYGTSITGNESKRQWFLEERFNTHNQFLDAMLLGGFVGLLLLLCFFGYTIAQLKSNFFAVSLLVSVVFFFAFENCLHRQLGCYVFAIILAMYHRTDAQKSEN